MELFLYLADGAEPAADRRTLGDNTLVVWVPDGAAAVQVAAAETDVALIEMHGFDPAAVADVVTAVGDRAAVGTTGPVPTVAHAATIYVAPVDAASLTHVLADGRRTDIRPAPDTDTAVALARELLAEGVGMVAMCGGTPIGDVVAVQAAVGDQVPVPYVTWLFDALGLAAAYAAAHA